MNFLTENLAIIHNRWPDIARLLALAHYEPSQVELIKDNELSLVFEQIQVASSFDQWEEANLQLSKLPSNPETVILYGTGLGKVQRALIDNKSLQQLTVYIFNLTLFKASLTYFEHQDWLLDERVNLQLPNQGSRVSQPFIALPAELVLATEASASLRDRVCLSLDHQFINRHKGEENLNLQKQIENNIDNIINDYNVSDLFLTAKKADYIICGAGPTLADHVDFLKKNSTRDKYTIVAVDAAVKPLFDDGIIPDIVVSIDPVAKKLLDVLPAEKYNNIPLIYFPVVSSELLDFWQGPRYIAYSIGKLYDEINKKHPKGRLYCAGSVIHPAIDLSVKMGAKEVLLLGADFSFPEGKSHTYWQEKESEDAIHLATDKTTHWVLNGFNEKVPTLLNYRGYLRDLEDYIALVKHVKFINGSKKGAFIMGTTTWSNSNEQS